MVSWQKRVYILIITSLCLAMIFPQNTVRGLLKSSNIVPADIYTNQWALIIGIDKYQDFPQLHYAVEDAKSIQILLFGLIQTSK